MSRYLNEWSLGIAYEPTTRLAIRFRGFCTERAARRSFRKEYKNNAEVRSVNLYAPIDKGRDPEVLK